MASRRFDIKAILGDPAQRRELSVKTIIATQAREGIETTREQAEAAYDKVRQEVDEQLVSHYARHGKSARPSTGRPGSAAWHFETNCVNSDSDSITDMVDAAKPVTYDTMLRVVGEPFLEMQRELGYDVGSMRGGLRMKNDWHVGYFKSTYRGRPCYFFTWSAIEYIFTQG